MIKQLDLQHFEINQLLDAIYFRYGYDFRDYARASLERKILHRVNLSKLQNISEMSQKILHDPSFFNLFLKDMSVTVTEMFRDPYVFKKLEKTVFLQLKTYSRVNIWHVGCATGEEAYSMAILLHENDLLKHTRIYATDYNNHSLDIAKKGIYHQDKIAEYSQNYIHAGGKSKLSDYYTVQDQFVTFNPSLKEHITFANHNLMKDQVFAQMHLILCRNVLIYFNATLQNRVLKLFTESLVHRGFLVLGDKESLEFNNEKESFENIAKKERIYQHKANL
ncbi:CheR family methyltransferase [Psychromonas sp. Urea-02u-13]|uniref:CheR family methyltransferase n=1 Tax=Psychromonas sp. Urea-02u-13 TaxID=2058326 RepID=UPI001E400C5C|nr:protein-glutamate O-methyltransferase CheR [Psychromonas sp. Urea-02u-13]